MDAAFFLPANRLLARMVLSDARATCHPSAALSLPLPCFVYLADGTPLGGAALLNVSSHGLLLYASRRPEPGELVSAELMDGPAALRRRLPLRVVYVRPEHGGFHIGGQFLHPLTPAELGALAG